MEEDNGGEAMPGNEKEERFLEHFWSSSSRSRRKVRSIGNDGVSSCNAAGTGV